MSEEAIRLPALPKPEVFRATWDGGVGWSQYHDERDPLPAEWDDGPPNEVRGFFTGEALQEYARAAVLAERERCALTCMEVGMDLVAAASRAGRSIDGRSVEAVTRVCAEEIRSGKDSPAVAAAIRKGA